MARNGISYQEVANAAQQLVAAGKNPTIEAIRGILGTGSNSTISALFRDWKAKQDLSQQTATKENLPPELIATLKGLWEHVMLQADNKIESHSLETQTIIDKLNFHNQELQQQNNYWQQQHLQLSSQHDKLTRDYAAAEKAVLEVKHELIISVEKHSAAELQNQERLALITELQRQNQQAQANLEHYRTASAEQRASDQLRFEQQHSQLETNLQIAYQKLTEVQHENQRNLFLIENLTAQLSEQKNLYNDLQQQKQARENVQQTAIIELQTSQALLLQAQENLKSELKNTQQQLADTTKEKWLLSQEIALLYGQVKQLDTIGLERE